MKKNGGNVKSNIADEINEWNNLYEKTDELWHFPHSVYNNGFTKAPLFLPYLLASSSKPCNVEKKETFDIRIENNQTYHY